MKTNKIQLLKGGKSIDTIYKNIKKYKRPDSYIQFNTQLKILHKILARAVENKKDIETINKCISNYYSYVAYYYEEYSNFFTIKEVKDFKKELNILMNTLNNLLDPETKLIIEKFNKNFKKAGTMKV